MTLRYKYVQLKLALDGNSVSIGITFWQGKSNLHLALRGVLGARDVEGIKVNMLALNGLDDEHLWREIQREALNVQCMRLIMESFVDESSSHACIMKPT